VGGNVAQLFVGKALGQKTIGPNAWTYFFHDHLGSSRAAYSEGQALIGRLDYTPYGEVRPGNVQVRWTP